MTSVYQFSAFLAFIIPVFGNSYDLDSLAGTLLRDVISHIGPEDYPGLVNAEDQPTLSDFPSRAFEARGDAYLAREPSIRDEEYLEHSSLFGPKYVTGGAGEGLQRLKPDGSIEKNLQAIKTDEQLPSYCIPPNPCPLGYSPDDGCLAEFENTASFSRNFQDMQQCMCDSEHMFECPGSNRESEIDALARTFQNEGLADVALDRLIKTMEPLNPFLEGEKLPVVAKKAPKSSIK